ncbi:integrase, catalytic region, zinc finger, CCHC-type containing protein [Tanacetum coccineum]|uniref:Integrase, catalytic region, zinc finger, CCHC-type containing protein n=1 Tax=Tanacetum coccineum TaxID=301880 RepID=A0ABQ4ZSZ9_9ASTR
MEILVATLASASYLPQQIFNLSKYIFDNMVKNLDGGVKFLMYLRFVQVFLDKQVEGMSKHKGVYVTPSHTKKVFANMKRPCKGFSGRVTPLFSTMMVQATEDIEPTTEETTPEEHVFTPSYDPPPSGEDIMQLVELMSLCTNLQEKVLDLEKAKTAQAKEITSLKKRVKQLEKRRKSRTSGLRRLRKVGSSSRVESSNDASLGAQEDASKQGRKIEDLDADAEVILVNETQEMNDDNLMFDTGVLEEQEIEFEKVVKEPVVSVATTTKSIPVSSTEVVTTASASVVIADELTLAQTLIEIKTAKPKPVTTVATTVTSVRPRAKGIIFHDQEEHVPASTKTFSSSQSQLPQVKDKGKGKMVEPEVPLKKKDQVALDEEMARNLKFTTKPPVIVEYQIDKYGRMGYFKLIRADGSSKRPEEDYERVLWGDLKVMFEPDIKSKVWRNLQGYKVTVWKLFDNYEVHFIQKMNIKFRGGLLGLKDFKMILRVTTAQIQEKKKKEIDAELLMSYVYLIFRVLLRATNTAFFSTWMAFGGNTRDLGSFGEETDKITDLHQNLKEVLLIERGDDIAGIKRHRRDPSSDGVRDLVMASGQLFDEQVFWLQTSHPNTDQSASSLVKIEAPRELPKVSLVNTSLKKLKYYLGQFDAVVKKRITPDAITEGEWGTYQNDERRNDKKKVKHEMEEIETINIELEHRKEVENASQIPIATTVALGIFKLDLDPLAPRLLQNRDAHIYYLKHTQEQADILWGIVEQAKAKQPVDNALDLAYKHATRIQESLVYVRDTCPNSIKLSEKKVDITPMNKVKKVRFSEPLTSSRNIKQVESSKTSDSNIHVIQIVLWYLDCGCSKHMTGNRSQLMNFVSKFLGTVRFGNDQVAKIMGYGDYQLGNTSLVYLLSKASKTKSWLWHRRLSHLNFGTLNNLAKDGLAQGIPKLKFQKDNLSLYYPTNDSEDLGKLNVKADIGFEESPKTPHFHDDPLHESLHEDLTSHGSSSNVRPSHTLFEHLSRWTKDHPIVNVIGDPSRSVSTRKQLETDAMWCYFDAFLTSVEPKNFKQAMTEPSWIDEM